MSGKIMSFVAETCYNLYQCKLRSKYIGFILPQFCVIYKADAEMKCNEELEVCSVINTH
jgi:hypothetical protein